MLYPGNQKNYQIQCWGRFGRTTIATQPLENVVCDKSFHGSMTIRNMSGYVGPREAVETFLNFSRADYEEDFTRYEAFRKISFSPVEVLRNYQRYCDALAKVQDNPAVI